MRMRRNEPQKAPLRVRAQGLTHARARRILMTNQSLKFVYVITRQTH